MAAMNIEKANKPKWKHTGAILAGGKSKRMGLAKPEVILPDGKPMINYVIEQLSSVCEKVVIVGRWKEEIKEYKKGIIQIPDDLPMQGPLEGIKTLLNSGIDSEYLVVACDQPFLTAELLYMLIQEQSLNLQLFKFENDTKIQPFPGYYPLSCLPYLQSTLESGKHAMYEFIKNTPVKWIQIKKDFQKFTRSINTKEELKLVFQMLSIFFSFS